MKDYTKKQINSARPRMSALEAVDFCLEALYDDTTHNFHEDINSRLTFEELLGALLLAKDELEIEK